LFVSLEIRTEHRNAVVRPHQFRAEILLSMFVRMPLNMSTQSKMMPAEIAKVIFLESPSEIGKNFARACSKTNLEIRRNYRGNYWR
jgi:hypothetical protein